MASRNFNYTGRMLIPQECIDARLSEIHRKAPLLELEFNWELKPTLKEISHSARVYVDVWKAMSFMRFDYGSFGNFKQPDNVALSELDSWTSADFIVRIVDEGVLLAVSKKHTVSLAQPDLKSRRSLIIAECEDLGERPWKLDVHETITIPRLVFNEKWWNKSSSQGKPLSEDSKVMGTIMPSVLEGMLNYLMIHLKSDLHRWFEDPGWKGAWIRFARSQLPNSKPPEYNENENDETEFIRDTAEWIAEVVQAYCETKALTSNLMDLMGGE